MKLTWKLLNELGDFYGESFYLLDTKRFEENYDELLKSFRDIYPNTFIAYSYKTNYIPQLCTLIDFKGGYAEVVSEMELDLAFKLGVSPLKIIYNGPYKTEKSIEKCLLGGGIVNLDSLYDLEIVVKIAQANPETNMSVGIRCNFNLEDSLISRFGFDIKSQTFDDAIIQLQQIENITLKGLHCHFPNRNIESYSDRVDVMLNIADRLFSSPPEFIDIGGGFFGKMEDSLKKQFKSEVPSYDEYATVIATKFQYFYRKLDEAIKPKLLLEPGTALVADTMKYVVKVIDIKTISNKNIATVSGSKFNITPLSNSINSPIKIYNENEEDCCNEEYDSIDIAGYTCIESDYLYKGYKGCLKVGAYVVFENAGSYSIVLKPPFISPNCPVIEYNSTQSYKLIKRKEENIDIFRTFKLPHERFLWMGGHLVSDNEAKLDIMSPTCQYGINIFEGIRCYLNENGTQLLSFRLKDHLDRLFNSAKILMIRPKYTVSEIQDAFLDTIIANGYMEDISVRIVFYVDEPGNWAYNGDCEMLIAPIPMGRAFNSKLGITACTSSWERINDKSVSPRIKAGANYINSRMAQLEALENGYDSALFLNKEGKVSEAPGSCIFIVRQGELITPPITASILESITRYTILDIAKNDLDLTIVERDIDRTELYISDEIFLCGTAVEIVPVLSVDKRVVADGEVGPLTNAIKQRYFDIVRGKVDKYKDWILPVNRE
jgi:diaminopimelate decarboxylase